MTTYEMLYEIVNPKLTNYREDLEKHDKNQLENWTGPFLYGYRPTGTNILKLGLPLDEWFPDMKHKPLWHPAYKLKDVEEACKVLMGELYWICPGADNKWFLYFDGNKFQEVSKERVGLIWTRYVDSLKTSLPFKMKTAI